MPLVRIALRDGRDELARSYTIEADRVRALKADGSSVELSLGLIDLERTFAANASTDFEPPVGPPPDGEPALEVIEHRERSVGDYIVVEGVVKNLTRADLGSVVAKVMGESEDGALLTSEEALVDWNPLRGGAQSSFKVVVRSGGKLLRTRLVFRSLLGEILATRGGTGEAKFG